MKIFAGGISTETNCFAPFPTTYADFVEEGIWIGNAGESQSFLGRLVSGWRDEAVSDGHEFIEGLFAVAKPAGPTTRAGYERLKSGLFDSYERKAPYDVVLLFLHGAMVADGYEDCEGDILEQLRGLCGVNTVIGVMLDPHCHLTDSMVRNADLLVCSKEYPHTDYDQRMDELYQLCIQTATGSIKPVSAVFDCKMIGFYPTTTGFMRNFVERQLALEKADGGLLSLSFVHGFELGDTSDTGSKMLVYADKDLDLAQQTAKTLGVTVYHQRWELLPSFITIEEAIAEIRQETGRTIIADVGDNPGAGFAADNTGILRVLLSDQVQGLVFGCLWDPMAVSICEKAGVGGEFQLRIGGKSGPASSAPLDLDVEVRAIKQDHQQTVFDSGKLSFGTAVWLRSGDADIVLTSLRQQVFSQDAFTGLGIDLETSKIIVVKSGQHFVKSFGPLSNHVLYVRAPDTIGLDLASIPHRVRSLDYFPRVDDPLELDK